jgi:hypothetical protein
LDGGSWTLLAEMVDVESGKNNGRPQLAKALELCRMTGPTLVVAKLHRLARNARFLLSVVECSGEGGVVFCDLPQVPAGPVGKFLVTQMAAVAELEAGLISQRIGRRKGPWNQARGLAWRAEGRQPDGPGKTPNPPRRACARPSRQGKVPPDHQNRRATATHFSSLLIRPDSSV